MRHEKTDKAYLWKRIGALVGITFAALIGMFFVVTRDIPPIDDSDLAVPEREVDPAQNPFPEFLEITLAADAADKVRRAKDMLAGKEALDEAFLDSLMDSFTEELERFDRYAATTQWRDERIFTAESVLPEMTAWRQVAMVKSQQASRNRLRGEWGAAAEKGLSLVRFGRRWQSVGGLMIIYLSGSVVATDGHRALAGLLAEPGLDAATLARLQAELNEIDFPAEDLVLTLKTEYVAGWGMIEKSTDEIELWLRDLGVDEWMGEIPPALVFRRNRTHLLFADGFRQMIREVPMIRESASAKTLTHAADIREDRLKLFASGNAAGRMLYSLFVPVFDRVSERRSTLQAQHDLLRVRIALELYHREHGDWPPDLAALVPRYLDAVPIDPMDSAPLRYDPVARVIYSIGIDFLDNGGVAPDKPGSLRSRKEIVIELEPAPTASSTK